MALSPGSICSVFVPKGPKKLGTSFLFLPIPNILFSPHPTHSFFLFSISLYYFLTTTLPVAHFSTSQWLTKGKSGGPRDGGNDDDELGLRFEMRKKETNGTRYYGGPPPPQGYPPQGYPPQGYPPPQQPVRAPISPWSFRPLADPRWTWSFLTLCRCNTPPRRPRRRRRATAVSTAGTSPRPSTTTRKNERVLTLPIVSRRSAVVGSAERRASAASNASHAAVRRNNPSTPPNCHSSKKEETEFRRRYSATISRHPRRRFRNTRHWTDEKGGSLGF